MSTNNKETKENGGTTNNSSTAPIKQPPKKKRKRGNFWLVKVPNWIADEWFDDTKYPNGARLGELYVSPNATDPNKKSMKLELTQPPLKRSKTSKHHNYNHYTMADDPSSAFKRQVNQFKDIPIPPLFKMEQRETRNP